MKCKPLRFRGRYYSAFLFDMDGTLLDSSAVVERVWRRWADRHNLDAETLLAAIPGVRAEDTIAKFGHGDVDFQAEAGQIGAEEIADVRGIVEIAGAASLLRGLPDDRWAVVTSAPRMLAIVRLRAAGLPQPNVMIAAEDVRRGKPDPDGFLQAARLLDVPIGQCLVFEDSQAGLAAATSAGADVVLVAGRTAAANVPGINDFMEVSQGLGL